jgi:hypothetical protein
MWYVVDEMSIYGATTETLKGATLAGICRKSDNTLSKDTHILLG